VVCWIFEILGPPLVTTKRCDYRVCCKKKHKKLEHQVLNTADTIIVTSATTKNLISALTTRPISVITNGYDVESDAGYRC
jgi:hypothetical protein